MVAAEGIPVIPKIPDVRIGTREGIDPTTLQRLLTLVQVSVNQLIDSPLLKGTRVEKVALNDGEITRVPHKLGRPPLGWFVTRTRLKGEETYETRPRTITSAATFSVDHGLGAAPFQMQPHLVCLNNEDGYTAGQIIYPFWTQTSDGTVLENGMTAVASDSSITVRYGTSATVFLAQNATTGAGVTLVNANWNLVIRAFRYRHVIDQQAGEDKPDQYLRLVGSGFVAGETCDLYVF